MKKSHTKTYVIVAIFISIIGISIAYAALQQQLQIKTNTTVQSSQTSWNIVFKPGDCAAQRSSKKPTIKIIGNEITISGGVLQAPNDSFGCSFSIENNGEVNAKISSINYKGPTIVGTGSSADADANLIKSNLWKYFHWSPTGDVVEGDLLNSGDTKYIAVGYGISSNMTTLPTNPVTFSNAVYTINFEQA